MKKLFIILSLVLSLAIGLVGLNSNVTVNAKQNETQKRMKELFPKGIPTKEAKIKPYLKTIKVTVMNENGKKSKKTVTVHKNLANKVSKCFDEMLKIKFPINNVDSYVWRKNSNGQLSSHSYGASIDINSADNPIGNNTSNSSYKITDKVVKIWKKYGFYWGGDWTGNIKDRMHFTYTNN